MNVTSNILFSLGQLLIIASGSALAWTSPVIPKLLSNDTEINPLGRPITSEEISMITGIPLLTSLIGCILLPKMSDVIGRKKYLQVLGLASVTFTVLLAYSEQIIFIILWRSVTSSVLLGFFTGFPIYLTEICEDHNRAKFGCLLGTFHQFGHLYSYAIGPFFSIKMFTLLTGLPALLFVGFSFFMPESPFFSLFKSRESECMKTLTKLRSNKNAKELQFDMIRINETLKQETEKSSAFFLFKTRENRIGLMLGLLPCLAQHLTGITAIMIYLAPIFNSTGIEFSGNHLAMVVGLVKTFTFTFTSFVVERFGRKRLLLISSIGSALPLFAMGIFFFLKQNDVSLVYRFQWLPVSCILSLILIYSLGLGPIPVAIMTEMFPSHHRSVASSIVVSSMTVVVTFITSSYPLISKYLGTQYCFWFFSSNCIVGAILIHVFLPDTKGMTLNEIQNMLKNY